MTENIIANGTHGECSWAINQEGVLRIYPTNPQKKRGSQNLKKRKTPI